MTFIPSPIIDVGGVCEPTNEPVRLVDQNGVAYVSDPISGIITVADYGDHPDKQLDALPGANASPIRVTEDATGYRFTLEWVGQQVDAELRGGDGTTVLFTDAAVGNLVMNGADTGPTTTMGLTVTPGGEANRNPTAVLAFHSTRPPRTWGIRDDQQIYGNHGFTADRPPHAAGTYFYDKTLEQPMWSDGAAWWGPSKTTGAWVQFF